MEAKRTLGQWEKSEFNAEYMDTSDERIYAGIHPSIDGSFVECNVWTPGCGFDPRRSTHTDIQSAKLHAETELRALL